MVGFVRVLYGFFWTPFSTPRREGVEAGRPVGPSPLVALPQGEGEGEGVRKLVVGSGVNGFGDIEISETRCVGDSSNLYGAPWHFRSILSSFVQFWKWNISPPVLCLRCNRNVLILGPPRDEGVDAGSVRYGRLATCATAEGVRVPFMACIVPWGFSATALQLNWR